MKMKVLIYYPENKLGPIGGPAGYLYNLKLELSNMQMNDIKVDFLPSQEEKHKHHQVLKKYVPIRIQEFVRALKMISMYSKKRSLDEIFFGYDVIHFHSTEELFLCRDSLKKYNGKVILTSHTPCVSFYEKLGRLNDRDIKLFGEKLDTLKLIDAYAFERADVILFPCEEAEEPYFHTWSEYSSIRKKEKYIYIPTGISPCIAKVSRNEIRKKYGISDDAFVISFVGRHNEIKGYEDLKKIGERMLKENVWFLIAGREAPIKGIKHSHWIEVGWTNDPHSIVNAADLFILPNHETYFDLVLLEVLSLGQIVVASYTGGNKYFSKYDDSGIFLYKNLDEAIGFVEQVRRLSDERKLQYREKNILLFETQFTTRNFTDKYLQTLKKLF